jgi:CHAT domain-containing protein/tetratricopeptide (TPR) repeat protein
MLYGVLGQRTSVLRVLRIEASFRWDLAAAEQAARDAILLGENLRVPVTESARDRLTLAGLLYYRVPFGDAEYAASDREAERALSLVRSRDDPGSQMVRAVATSLLAVSHDQRGCFAESERYWNATRRAAAAAGDGMLEMEANVAIASRLSERGLHAEAFTAYDRILSAIERRLADMRWVSDWAQVQRLRQLQAYAYQSQAHIAALYGQLEAAISLERSSIRVSRESGLDLYALGQARIADHLIGLGRQNEAEQILKDALATTSPRGDTTTFVELRKPWIRILLAKGRYGEALACLHETAAVAVARRFDYVLPEYHTRAGEVLLKQRNWRLALTEFDEAWRIVGGDDIPQARWRVHLGRAEALEGLGRRSEAFSMYEAAIRDVEKYMRRAAPTAMTTATVLEGSDRAYNRGYDLAARMGRWSKAFEIAERSRARLLLQAMSVGAQGRRNSLSKADAAKDADIRSRWALTQVRLARAVAMGSRGASEANRLRLQNARINAEREAFHKMVSLRKGGSSNLRSVPEPPLLESLPSLAREVGGAILYFFVSGEACYRTTADAHGTRTVRLGIGASELNTSSARLLRQLRSPDGEYMPLLCRTLYDELLRGAEPVLRRNRLLCIIPDGPLWKMPFAALARANGSRPRFLVQDHVLLFGPSAAAIKELLARSRSSARRSNGTPSVAVVCNPRLPGTPQGAGRVSLRSLVAGDGNGNLPYADREAQHIQALYGNRVRVWRREAATVDAVRESLSRYRIAHLATHAVFVPESPMSSGLLLANRSSAQTGWVMEARDIAAMDIAARLVVYSACDSGRGRIAAGEGLLGLTWATFVGGALTQVASLWPVQDAATSRLMTDFYRELRRGKRPAEALRDAQVNTLARPDSRPFHWAGFVCIGAGTPP